MLVPGARRVEGTLDAPDADATACVVACPPHPQHGGNRRDGRLRAVADYLNARGVACLRFDYGPWDDGVGEREDARNAVRWARDRYDRVGLFGFSFGASMAALAAADVAVDALALLAPAANVGDDLGVPAFLRGTETPCLVVYGERDDLADWRPVVDAARDRGARVEGFPGDHFFVGQHERVADRIGGFLVETLTA